MKVTFAAVALAAVSGAAAASNDTVAYVTEVVTAFTTYCPVATTLTHGSKTYTVSEATTLTITDCPCTVTKPASSPVAPVAVSSAPYAYSNGTTAAVTPAGTAAASGTQSGGKTTSTFAGAAAANQAGMGLAAIMGLAAFAL
ncbi:hypothetical protein AAFC00_001001 [Neodothiora populina]|uniref:Clock-controlled protein 6 n=1 Tax=Neodothiora populina TaxID=2781224 RepID=A0ABR3PNH2_9PEZI